MVGAFGLDPLILEGNLHILSRPTRRRKPLINSVSAGAVTDESMTAGLVVSLQYQYTDTSEGWAQSLLLCMIEIDDRLSPPPRE